MPLVLLKADPRARLKPCLRCGYSLRSITDARNCPECGLAIRLSLGGDDALDVSKPEWVRAVAVGLAVAAASHLVALAAVLVALAQAARDEPSLVFYLWAAPPPFAIALGLVLVVHHGALVVLARPEGRVPDRTPVLRWMLRIFGYGGILIGLGLLAYGATGRAGLPLTLLAVLALAADLATLNRLREMARRLPNRRLAWFAEMLAWAAALGGAFALFQGADELLIALLMPFGFRKLGLFWVGFLVLYPVVCVVLMLWTANAVRVAAVAAEKNWVSDPEFR